MTDPIPINLAAIEARASQRQANQAVARQEASQARLVEDLERSFNPQAAEREQSRYGRFRTIESRRKTDTTKEAIQAVESKTEEDLAQNYSRRNPELPADKLRRLQGDLRNSQSPEEILNQVKEAFDDPTLADETLEFLEKTTKGVLRDKVRQARELLNEKEGREILAGRNIDTVAKSAHRKGLGKNPSELRNLYREVTGNPRDHNALFSELSSKYPFDQLKQVVAFLLKGMAYDLKSKGPSIQHAELMRLLTETRNLQSILWIYIFFKSRSKLIKSLYKQYGANLPEKLTFEKLAKDFIKLVEERYPSLLKLLKQLESLDLMEDFQKIIILMQYRDAIRGLSPRIYKSPRHKQELLLVILETLEELEDRDQEEEEATHEPI